MKYGWISVNDELPNDDETVVCKNFDVPDKDVAPIVCYFDAEEREFYHLYDLHSHPIKITHWKRV